MLSDVVLCALQEETDVYIGEVEQIGAAYEDMMGQNNRLLAQLADNDRVNSEIVAERVKVSLLFSGSPPHITYAFVSKRVHLPRWLIAVGPNGRRTIIVVV
jgi:hypothetical protein